MADRKKYWHWLELRIGLDCLMLIWLHRLQSVISDIFDIVAYLIYWVSEHKEKDQHCSKESESTDFGIGSCLLRTVKLRLRRFVAWKEP